MVDTYNHTRSECFSTETRLAGCTASLRLVTFVYSMAVVATVGQSMLDHSLKWLVHVSLNMTRTVRMFLLGFFCE